MFDAIGGIPLSFDDAWTASHATRRVRSFEDFGEGAGEGLLKVFRGKNPPALLRGGG